MVEVVLSLSNRLKMKMKITYDRDHSSMSFHDQTSPDDRKIGIR